MPATSLDEKAVSEAIQKILGRMDVIPLPSASHREITNFLVQIRPLLSAYKQLVGSQRIDPLVVKSCEIILGDLGARLSRGTTFQMERLVEQSHKQDAERSQQDSGKKRKRPEQPSDINKTVNPKSAKKPYSAAQTINQGQHSASSSKPREGRKPMVFKTESRAKQVNKILVSERPTKRRKGRGGGGSSKTKMTE